MQAFEIPNTLLEIERELHAWAEHGRGNELPPGLRDKIDRLKAEGPPALDDLYLALVNQEKAMEALEAEEKRLFARRQSIKATHAKWRELMLEIVQDCFGGHAKGVHRAYSARERNGITEIVVR